MDWTLPERFVSTLDHSSEALRLTLDCAPAKGAPVVVSELTLTGHDGRSISPRDLSAVELGRAVYLVTEARLLPEAARHLDRRPGRGMSADELRLLAAVYAVQVAAWGKPRQAVMGLWGLPSATASRWIRKARELYPDAIPQEEGGGDDGEHPAAP